MQKRWSGVLVLLAMGSGLTALAAPPNTSGYISQNQYTAQSQSDEPEQLALPEPYQQYQPEPEQYPVDSYPQYQPPNVPIAALPGQPVVALPPVRQCNFLEYSPGNPYYHPASLIITIANDTDLDLDVIAPINLYENMSHADVKRLTNQTLYAHQRYTFEVTRTCFPAQLFLIFRVALTEGPRAGMTVARWEYAEKGKVGNVQEGRLGDSSNILIDATCHNEISRLPYSIGCSGDNDFWTPRMSINILRTNSAMVPRPLVNGGEPGAGPPSTP